MRARQTLRRSLPKPLQSWTFAAFALILVSCAGDYNPFSDTTNARVLIVENQIQDTVRIFSTASMTLRPVVAELIDSLRIESPGNRFWTDTVIVSPRIGSFSLDLSFHDTGRQQIVITTCRRGGDVVRTELVTRAVSPLRQDTIREPLGAPCTLTTGAVADPGVLYHWTLGSVAGSPQEFVSSLPFTTVIPRAYDGLTGQNEYDTGSLWVGDTAGRHRSPVVNFAFGLFDRDGPVIVCLNDSVSGDTVVTGDSVLVFRLRIYDPSGGVVAPRIDGGRFDEERPQTGLFYHLFEDMASYPAASPRKVSVSAWDRAGNVSMKTFHLSFAAGGPRSDQASITFLNPRNNPSVASVQDLPVICRIDNYTGTMLVGRASVNGSELDNVRAFGPGQDTISWPVTLTEGANSLAVWLTDTTGAERARQTLSVLYSPGALDTVKPYIWRVTVNDQVLAEDKPLYTRSSDASIDIVVFDEGKGVDSVYVNGLRAQNLLLGNVWKLSGLVVRHPYDSLRIRAVDKAGNVASMVGHIVSNTQPSFESGWLWPERFVAGRTYLDTIRIWDDDGDEVSLSLVGGAPDSMSLRPAGTNQWALTWNPRDRDTGSSSVVVRISDRYQDSLFLWNFWTTGTSVAAVRFSTTESEFPAFLQASRESLSVTLRVAPSTGLPPFVFDARLLNMGRVLLDSSLQALLTWSPAPGDTGRKQLFVEVTDKRGDRDTLYPSVIVVPPNSHACSLSYTFSGSKAGDTLDMRRSVTAQTVLLTIHDNDHPLTERYTVSVLHRGARTVHVVDSTKRLVVELAPVGPARDSIEVSVRDLTGTSDTVLLRIVRGIESPDQIQQLGFWLDASTGIESTPSGVHRWTMSSGSGFDFHIEDTANRPDLITNAINSLPALHFDGVNQNLHSQTGTDDWIDKPFTFFFVARLDEVVAGRRYTLVSAGADMGVDLGVTCAGKLGAFVELSTDGCFGGAQTVSTDLTIAAKTWYLVTYRSVLGHRDGTLKTEVWRNGLAASSSISVTGNSGTDILLGAGEMSRYSGAWKGSIAEVVYFDRALSADERASVEVFLSRKFAIALESSP